MANFTSQLGTNYTSELGPAGNTDLHPDFIAASALLEEDDAMLDKMYTPTPPGGKKPNLSKLTDALKSKVIITF